MRSLKKEEATPLSGEQIIDIFTTGVKLVDATEPFIKMLYDKIAEAIKNLGGPNSPQGRRRRIEALEAQNLLQKEFNKIVKDKLGL